MHAHKYPFWIYPREVKAFRRMHYRCKRGCATCSFKRTANSFDQFINHIGAIPKKMKEPSLGRIDHSKGYKIGNIKWQDRKENNGEPHSRPEVRKIQVERVKRLFSRKGVKDAYAKMMRSRHKKIWTPENRQKASERMKGNRYASKTH